MEDKVTAARIGAYAARLAQQACTTALAGQEAVEGPALLSLTPIRQLNLLVLHRLMFRWKQETERLRSPYFNYEAPEVQQALAGFMATLSRHIRVKGADLEPLVAEAAADALGLAFDPAAAYAQRFLPTDEAGAAFITDSLRADLKYVDVNKALFEGFINQLPTTPLDRAGVLSRLKLYATAHFREVAAPDAVLREFSEIVPVTLADLREPAGAVAPAPAPVVAPIAAAPQPAPVAEAPTPKAPEPIAAPKVAEPAPVAAPAPPPAARPQLAPLPAPPARAPLVTAEGTTTPLHEKLRHDHEKSNLNDQLRSKVSQAPGLAEVLETKAKIESIGKAITTNQKFTFIAQLFDGDRAAYDAAVVQLDAQPTAAAAHALLNGGLATTHGWADTHDEYVQKISQLIERKFA